MTPDELREEITRHQTACRCGHLLAACADCRDWLSEHGSRIEAGWRWYVNHLGYVVPAGLSRSDAAEAADRAYFGL
jgi:hypothetical protein